MQHKVYDYKVNKFYLNKNESPNQVKSKNSSLLFPFKSYFFLIDSYKIR